MAPLAGSRDYYALLQVERTADAAAIAASYRRLARLKHPDKNPDSAGATSEFQALQEAYTVLKDEQKRSEYDRQLAAKAAATGRRRHRHDKPGGLYSFHVSKTWDQERGTPTDGPVASSWADHPQASYPPSPPQKPAWPDRAPRSDPGLEREIQALRKSIRSDDKGIADLAKKNRDREELISVLWRLVHEVDELIAKAALKQAQLEQSAVGQAWPHGLFGEGTAGPAVAPAAALPSMQQHPHDGRGPPLSHTEKKIEDATRVQKKLQKKLQRIHADLEAAIVESRSMASQVQEATQRRTEKEARLTELCRRWSANEFGSGEQEATGRGTPTDWYGWCGWDGGETEWPDHVVDQWWESDFEPHGTAYVEEEEQAEDEEQEPYAYYGPAAEDDQEPGGVPLAGEHLYCSDGEPGSYEGQQADSFEEYDDYVEHEDEYAGEAWEGKAEHVPADESADTTDRPQTTGVGETPLSPQPPHLQPVEPTEPTQPTQPSRLGGGDGNVWTDEFDADLLGMETEEGGDGEGQQQAPPRSTMQAARSMPTTGAAAAPAGGGGWWRVGGAGQETNRLSETWDTEWQQAMWREW